MRPLATSLLLLVTACAAKKEAAPPPPQAPPETTTAPPPPTGAPAAEEAPKRDELREGEGAVGGGAPGGSGGASRGLERAAPAPTMHRRVGGAVKIGEPKVTNLDDGQVATTLTRATDELKKCYEKELLVSPSLQGIAEVKISVAKDSSVSAKAEGVGNAALEACVAETLEKSDFGRPQGRAQVTVRITFAPES